MSLRLQTQQRRFRLVVGDMPLEAGVPAMQARFQDRGSVVITRHPTRLRAFVLSQPWGHAVLSGGVTKEADATQAAMSPEHQLLRAITWLLMTVLGCAPLPVFCWNATVHNIVTSSMQARLLRPNELTLSKALREARGLGGGGACANDRQSGRRVSVVPAGDSGEVSARYVTGRHGGRPTAAAGPNGDGFGRRKFVNS